MPTETAHVQTADQNPEGTMANGASSAVNEMFSKFTSEGVTKWNMDGEKPEAMTANGDKPEVPESEREKPELDKPEVAKADAAKPAEVKADVTKTEPAAPVDVLTIELPRSASPKANEQFNKLKEAIKAERTKAEPLAKKLEEAEKQIEALKKNAPVPTDYEDLKKQRDELDNIVKVSAVERHPQFKKYFDGKIAAATDLAVSIAGTDNKAAIEAALKMPDGSAKDSAIDDILSVLPQYKAVQLGSALAEFPKIQRERESELANARKSYDQLEAQKTGQTEAQKQERAQQVSAIIQKAQAASADIEAFKEIAGDADHNEKAAANKAFISDFFNGKIKEEIKPMIPVMVCDYLHLKNTIMPKMKAQLEAIQTQLQSLQGAAPKLEGGGGKKAADSSPEGESFVGHFARLARGE